MVYSDTTDKDKDGKASKVEPDVTYSGYDDVYYGMYRSVSYVVGPC